MISNFDSYKVFYYVAHYRNITLAAKALYLTQPTVSHYVLNLEKELDCRLFIRSKKGVTLTPEGGILYQHIARAYKEIFRGEEELQGYLRMGKGLIKVGASETSLRTYLMPILGRFRTKYPDIHLRIVSTTYPLAAAALKDGGLDFAVMTTPFPSNDFTLQKLQDFSMSVIAGPAFSHLAGSSLSYKKIAEYPLICLEPETTGRRYLDTLFASHGITLHPDIELSSADLITPMAAENMGIGFVPKVFAEEAIRDGSVIELHPESPPPLRSICMLKEPQRHLSLACQKFMAELEEENE